MDLLVGSRENIIGSILLVGRDEVGVVDRGERDHLLHERSDLSLEVVLEDLGSSHRLIERHGGDVPASEDKVVGVTGEKGRTEQGSDNDFTSEGKSVDSHHGENVREGDVDVLPVRINSKSKGRSSDELNTRGRQGQTGQA